jgi:1,2-diacylglycerol 3-alpha-glucosyltransferase
MGLPHVAAFTDTYLPTINGATYTIETWRDRWRARGGRMDVVYPRSGHEPGPGEYPVGSLPFPFYEGFRVGLPAVPDPVEEAEVVHMHTPFSLGIAGMRLARRTDVPLVASYHTPTSEYAEYVSITQAVERAVERSAEGYERRFFDRADVVLVPSEWTAAHVRENVGLTTDVSVVPNGVDTDFFRPLETDVARDRLGLSTGELQGPLIGYTGRHGYEKQLHEIITAADGMDVTVLFGGDGPARESLERRAESADVDVRFLGFLDRENLPALYSLLDVFAFPSPVETQGLAALEANACGTPVAGVDSGALSDTIDDGETGYTAPAGDIDTFGTAIEQTLDERERLRDRCIDRREHVSVEHAVDELEGVYERVQ